MLVPHALELYGHVYRVRWGSSSDPTWDPESDEAQVVHGPEDAEPGQDTYTITLHPGIRGSRARSRAALVHEILHIIDYHEPRARSKMSPEERARVTRWTWPRWKPLDHKLVHQLDTPLSRFLETVEFRCVCEPCRKKLGAA